jgi:hypothetical protein
METINCIHHHLKALVLLTLIELTYSRFPNALLHPSGGARGGKGKAVVSTGSSSTKYGNGNNAGGSGSSSSGGGGGGGGGGSSCSSSGSATSSSINTARARTWIPSSLMEQIPSFQVKIDPTTSLKIRKFFYPLRTKLEIGADFNSQLSLWQFKSSWEDQIIHGKLTVKGRELQFTKMWMVYFSENENLHARLRLKFAVDILTGRTYCRFGFRTEDRASVNLGMNFQEGFPLEKTIRLAPPSYLDGGSGMGSGAAGLAGTESEGGQGVARGVAGHRNDSSNNGRRAGNIFCELKGRVALPAPDFEFKSELGPGKQVDLGMGDVAVSLDELNLLIHF